MVEHLKALFPRLQKATFRVTSDADAVYNCIAWAAGVTNDWWWPLEDPTEAYWPEGIPRERTVEAFRDVFATLGYTVCSSEELEPGFEKIALFTASNLPTHAARQLPSGLWTSKLGQGEDIEHGLHDLEGDLYGTVALVMQRPLPGLPAASS
jgi:hypothetical protein